MPIRAKRAPHFVGPDPVNPDDAVQDAARRDARSLDEIFKGDNSLGARDKCSRLRSVVIRVCGETVLIGTRTIGLGLPPSTAVPAGTSDCAARVQPHSAQSISCS
jgi:hypothetical protein